MDHGRELDPLRHVHESDQQSHVCVNLYPARGILWMDDECFRCYDRNNRKGHLQYTVS